MGESRLPAFFVDTTLTSPGRTDEEQSLA